MFTYHVLFPTVRFLSCSIRLSGQGAALTPLALKAFTEIFRRYSHNDVMDLGHMVRFFINWKINNLRRATVKYGYMQRRVLRYQV